MVRLSWTLKYADNFDIRIGCQISSKIGYPNLGLKIANNIYTAWGRRGGAPPYIKYKNSVNVKIG